MISKPMSRKISLISSSTVYMGCLWPRVTSLPGMVTSSVSASSLRFQGGLLQNGGLGLHGLLQGGADLVGQLAHDGALLGGELAHHA